MAKKNQDKLVKIDEVVYAAMKKYVEAHKLDYPSMKHFVERAIVQSIGFKKYDIDGTDNTYDETAPLHKVVGDSQGGGFTLCVVCDRPFLREARDTSDTSKICPNCQNTIKHFAPKLNNSEKEIKPTEKMNKIDKLFRKK